MLADVPELPRRCPAPPSWSSLLSCCLRGTVRGIWRFVATEGRARSRHGAPTTRQLPNFRVFDGNVDAHSRDLLLLHDAATALLEDGVLVAAGEQERFTRVEHDFGFPERRPSNSRPRRGARRLRARDDGSWMGAGCWCRRSGASACGRVAADGREGVRWCTADYRLALVEGTSQRPLIASRKISANF